jgi:hypothetical protein
VIEVRAWCAVVAGGALMLAIADVATGTTSRASPWGREARIEGVAFPESVVASGARLELQNLALLRYRVVFKAYVAGLYLGEGIEASRVLDDVPKRLEIEYFWPIEAADFARVTTQGIEQNVDRETLARLRPRIARLNELYRDVEPSDRYALTYLPHRGTELSLNGRALGTIEGADFATAVFSIWFGDEPLDGTLKQELLAERE